MACPGSPRAAGRVVKIKMFISLYDIIITLYSIRDNDQLESDVIETAVSRLGCR